MKKFMALFMAILLTASLAACSADKDSADDDKNTTAAQAGNTTAAGNNTAGGTTAAGTSVQWPEEFDKWDVPIIKSAKVTLANNTSMSGGILVTGINVVVNLDNVTKADFESYKETLTVNGFTASDGSLPEVLEVFEKPVTGGTIKITLSYTQDSTTIVVNNSAAAAAKDTTDGGKTQWPAAVKEVPEFTKGTYIETIPMGGNMYTVSFSGVTDADLDWYRGKLASSGFISQENEDTEGYAKITANATYSVGFTKTGNKLQIIVAFGTY
jgi:hypothetical protein